MSTAIGKRLTSQLKTDVDNLLGRGRTAVPCPLGQGALVEFWHNTFPTESVAAYKLLNNRGYGMSSLTASRASCKATIEGKERELIFDIEDRQFLRPPDTHDIRHLALWDYYPQGVAPWEKFVEWVEFCSIVDYEFKRAYIAFCNLIDICGTVGQLTRACPELALHLPARSRAALREQARPSNMPYEWALFDRDLVRTLQMSICKAALLPSGSSTWTGYSGTWAGYA